MTTRNIRSRYTDAEVDDLITTVRTLAETIRVFQEYQNWGHRSVPEWVEVLGGHGAEIHDAMPAVRRTFLLLEER